MLNVEPHDRAVSFVTANFVINVRVRDVLSTLGLVYSTRDKLTFSKQVQEIEK